MLEPAEQMRGLRDQALQQVGSRLPPGRVLAYELSGGTETDHPWTTVGFFAALAGGSRIVFELLDLSEDTILLRVFREEDGQLLWEALAGEREPDELRGAVDAFLDPLAGHELVDVVREDAELRTALPPEMTPEDAALVLYPIPRPIDPELASRLQGRPN